METLKKKKEGAYRGIRIEEMEMSAGEREQSATVWEEGTVIWGRFSVLGLNEEGKSRAGKMKGKIKFYFN